MLDVLAIILIVMVVALIQVTVFGLALFLLENESKAMILTIIIDTIIIFSLVLVLVSYEI